MGKGSLTLCLLALALISTSIPSLALELTYSGLQCILKTSSDIQSCRLNNYRILEPSVQRQLLLE